MGWGGWGWEGAGRRGSISRRGRRVRYPARTMERCGHEKQLKTCRILGASQGRAGVYGAGAKAIRPSWPAVGTNAGLARGASEAVAPKAGADNTERRLSLCRLPEGGGEAQHWAALGSVSFDESTRATAVRVPALHLQPSFTHTDTHACRWNSRPMPSSRPSARLPSARTAG